MYYWQFYWQIRVLFNSHVVSIDFTERRLNVYKVDLVSSLVTDDFAFAYEISKKLSVQKGSSNLSLIRKILDFATTLE